MKCHPFIFLRDGFRSHRTFPRTCLSLFCFIWSSHSTGNINYIYVGIFLPHFNIFYFLISSVASVCSSSSVVNFILHGVEYIFYILIIFQLSVELNSAFWTFSFLTIFSYLPLLLFISNHAFSSQSVLLGFLH